MTTTALLPLFCPSNVMLNHNKSYFSDNPFVECFRTIELYRYIDPTSYKQLRQLGHVMYTIGCLFCTYLFNFSNIYAFPLLSMSCYIGSMTLYITSPSFQWNNCKYNIILNKMKDRICYHTMEKNISPWQGHYLFSKANAM